MKDEIVRPQDFDQVLFMGENSIELMEFRLKFPQPGDYSGIVYGEPHSIGGMFKRERTAWSVSNHRILKQPVNIKGKRTLIVLADLNSTDKNRSILDIATMDLQRQIEELTMKNKNLEDQKLLMDKFIATQHLEDAWEEWLVNKLELLRVAQQKTSKPESGQSVSVEVGDQKERK